MRALLARYTGVGPAYPLSAEKLCPVLALYVEKNWEDACERCRATQLRRPRPSLVIHSGNQAVIRSCPPEACQQDNGEHPRIAGRDRPHNRPRSIAHTGVWFVGGNITSDNVGPLHLMNRKRPSTI